MGLTRVILYVRDMDGVAAFYCGHFGFSAVQIPGDRILELRSADEGALLLLHPAGKAQKQGQVQAKLVFDVSDVAAKRAELIGKGVEVGPVHAADGYGFANLKDPAGNAVQISGRAANDRPRDGRN